MESFNDLQRQSLIFIAFVIYIYKLSNLQMFMLVMLVYVMLMWVCWYKHCPYKYSVNKEKGYFFKWRFGVNTKTSVF